jgi:hypothetical protein
VWQKKLTPNGFVVCWRMTPISARMVSALIMAPGRQPRPPASLAAMTMADPLAPAITTTVVATPKAG